MATIEQRPFATEPGVPQPPSEKKSHKIRNAAAALGGFLVLLAGVAKTNAYINDGPKESDDTCRTAGWIDYTFANEAKPGKVIILQPERPAGEEEPIGLLVQTSDQPYAARNLAEANTWTWKSVLVEPPERGVALPIGEFSDVARAIRASWVLKAGSAACGELTPSKNIPGPANDPLFQDFPVVNPV